MTYRTPLILLLAMLLLALLSQSMFQVPQGSVGVIFRLQSPRRLDLAPGAHFKLPFVDDAVTLDAGGIALDSDLVNGGRLKFQSADGRTLETGYFALWRITDVGLFCRTTGCDENNGTRKLNDLIVPKLHDLFAYQSSKVLLSSQTRLADGLAGRLDGEAARLGMRLEQLQLTGVSLNGAGLEEIYGRMRSAAAARAAEVRAEGTVQAGRVRARADAERDQVLALADDQAKKIRASGEAQAAAITAAAARQDPEFFSYVQSLEACRRSLSGRAVLVLDQDSSILKFCKSPER